MSDKPTWDDTYLVGIDMIDDQHKVLFDLAADLNNAARNGSSRKVIGTLFTVINNFAISHFETEEKLFEQNISYTEHCLEHYQFLKQLQTYVFDFHSGSNIHPAPGLFLHQWLQEHILTSDQPLLKKQAPEKSKQDQEEKAQQSGTDQEERRASTRLTPASLGKDDMTSHCFNATKSITGLATIHNISRGGVKLSSKTRHNIGDVLFINCKVTEDDDRINEKIKIINAETSNMFGAKFISPKMQTLNLIKELEQLAKS